MSTGMAILFTIGLFVLCVFIGGATNLAPLVTVAMVLASAIWAAFDASKIQFKKYKSGLAGSTIGVFLAVALLWIITFPWYLSVRGKIKNGEAELKDEYQSEIVVKPQFVSQDSSADTLMQIEKLATLKEKGILTDEEFQREKKKLFS